MISRGTMFGGAFWPWLGRPAITWQLVSFMLLFPAVAIALVYSLARLIGWIAGRGRLKAKEASPEGSRPASGGRASLAAKTSARPIDSDGNDASEGAASGSGIVWLEKVKAPNKLEALAEKAGLTRRDFLRKAAAGGLLTAAAVSGYGLLRQSLPPHLVRKTLPFPNLPQQLAGFKICQISDVHLGMWLTQGEMANAFERAAEEKPDLVVLTGDLVDTRPSNAKLYYEPLGVFDGVPHGVYAILGNHDHYTGASEVALYLGRRLHMLVQKRVLLPDAPMTIVGLDDPGSRGSFLGARWKRQNTDKDPDVLSFSGVQGPPFRAGDFNLLLNHRPEGYRQASREGFDLYLAGHTHGGQYQVPFFKDLNLAAIFYKYSSGLYHEHPTWLNVSRGLGSVGLPFRVVAWPEIDLITLVQA
jgi:predicted MPP superfamily phosphohydrolase